MTDRERFGPEWAKEIERRFQQQVQAEWTRARIDELVKCHGLSFYWKGHDLCFLHAPQGGGIIAIRLGQPITDEDERAIAALNAPQTRAAG